MKKSETSADRFLRNMHSLGLLLVLFAFIWLIGWCMGLLRWLGHWSLNTRTMLTPYPFFIFLAAGGALIGLRFAIWLQQISGVPPWWDNER